MTQLRGRTAGLAVALALGAAVLAGCGGGKSTPSSPGTSPAPANTQPASHSSPPVTSSSSSSSGGSGGYGY